MCHMQRERERETEAEGEGEGEGETESERNGDGERWRERESESERENQMCGRTVATHVTSAFVSHPPPTVWPCPGWLSTSPDISTIIALLNPTHPWAGQMFVRPEYFSVFTLP